MLKKKSLLLIVLMFAICAALLACAPSGGTGSENTDSGNSNSGNAIVGGEFTWTAESDCGTCHSRAVTTVAALTCEAAQQDEPNKTCLVCHDDAAGVEAAHANVTLADTEGDQSRLKKTKVTDDVCLTCHNLDELAAATAGKVELTDANGTTVNPHEVKTVHNVAGNHDSVTCSSCHKMHSEKSTEENARLACLSCHHTGVYECYTCHGPE